MFNDVLEKVKKSKGQTSLEILIVMGGLIIIAVVVVTIILASSKSKVSAITTADKANADIIDKTLFPPNINSVQCSLDDTNTNVNFNISVISSVTKDISEYCLILNGTTTGLCSSAGNTELSFSSNNLGTGNYRVNLVSKNSNNATSSNSVGFSCDLDLPTTTIPIVIIPPIGETLDFNCPSGYAKVPGNPEYETGNLTSYPKGGFCVMKWEAKMDFDNDGVGDVNKNCAPPLYNKTGTYYRGTYVYHYMEPFLLDVNSPTDTNLCALFNPTVSCGARIYYYTIWDYSVRCPVLTSTPLASTSQGMPISGLTLATAKQLCESQGTGTLDEGKYHLITNDEWMTTARNIEQETINWPVGTIGSGSLKVGNIGNFNGATSSSYAYGAWEFYVHKNPTLTKYNYYRMPIDFNVLDYNVLVDLVDLNPAYGTYPTSVMQNRRSVYCTSNCFFQTGVQPSKLFLSTGDDIWDLSGNLYEFVDKQLYASNLPKTDPSFLNQWVEFNQITSNGTLQDKDFKPGNPMWSSAQGMGKIIINWTYAGNIIFIRGGNYDSGTNAGIYSLDLIDNPNKNEVYIGFRCVYTPS